MLHRTHKCDEIFCFYSDFQSTEENYTQKIDFFKQITINHSLKCLNEANYIYKFTGTYFNLRNNLQKQI